MDRVVSFDTPHRERRRIVRLLDFLKRDNLTRDQLERIGRRLQKSGRRALPPLVRRLWHEQSSEQLYRYTCMLDFFDAANWLDQLVQLTIKRRDLGEEGRIPLLEILQDYGVDISCPPFSRSNLSGNSLATFIETCLTEGALGLSRFMDRFLDSDETLRIQLIRQLGDRADHGCEAAAILRMLAYFEYTEAATQAVETLGRLRHPASLTVLRNLNGLLVGGLEATVERSIRRLEFLGIREGRRMPPQLDAAAEVISTQSSPFDAYGLRTAWISWRLPDSTPVALVLQIGEGEGVLHAVQTRFTTIQEHDEYQEEVNAEEGMFPVSLTYLQDLLKDALQQSIEHNYYLPPDLYAARYLFGNADLHPARYLPSFPIELLDGLVERLASHLAESEKLLEEPFFEGWILSDPLVYDLAEAVDSGGLSNCPADQSQAFVNRMCAELLEPKKVDILRCLLLSADFMQQCGAESDLVQRVLAVSLSLVGAPLSLSYHPFIRRLALDSIEVAHQSLNEGYDPRRYQRYDDEEWE